MFRPNYNITGILYSLYLSCLVGSYKQLSILNIWYRDIYMVWIEKTAMTISVGIQYPNHQLIYYKIVHRMYLTPWKCFVM